MRENRKLDSQCPRVRVSLSLSLYARECMPTLLAFIQLGVDVIIDAFVRPAIGSLPFPVKAT